MKFSTKFHIDNNFNSSKPGGGVETGTIGYDIVIIFLRVISHYKIYKYKYIQKQTAVS